MSRSELESLILEMAKRRGAGKSLCPSEVARKHFPEDAWRAGMTEVMESAGRLEQEGLIQILQKGKRVDPFTVKGPVRLALG